MQLQKILAAILCAVTSLVYAAEENTPLEILIVTGTRTAQPLKQALLHSTVITAEEIRAAQVPDVPTLLRSLAGVEVVQSGGLGKQSSIFMRGTNSSHVLILLDGVRINSATVGTTALEHIMLDSIERIEVVRGNVSSLYGSEAIGGVIQLFTKRGRGAPVFNVSEGVGSNGTQRLSAGFSGSADATSFSVNAGKVKTNGVSAINAQIVPAANPDTDGYDNTTFNAQVKQVFNADHQLSAALFSAHGNSQYDSAWGSPTDLNNTKVALEKISLTSDDQLTALWHSKLNLAQGTDNSKDYKNGVENSRFKTANKQLTWQNELRLADTQRVNLTAEHLQQSVASDTSFTRTKRSVSSLLGGYVGEYGAQQVQLNLRQDRYSDFGTANTGLLGYGWAFVDNWRATASVSTAFKAPTFNDMYYPFQDYGAYGSYVGNPNLRPERSKNKEFGLRYAVAGQHADVMYFDNHIRDLIAPDNLFAGSVININQVRIDGWELSYAGEFDDTRVKANITLQNPRDTETGQILTRRAKRYSSVGITQQFGALKLGGEWQHSGVREDNHITAYPAQRVTLAAYDIINFTTSYALDKHLDLSMRVDNLFNKDYMLAHGYNTLGRTLFVSLHYQ
ncbi:MAG: TonB-dependent receptor [Gallionellaceae bacterium]|nr:TonB-dependent receptor [Gallionellaceae bacterium]